METVRTGPRRKIIGALWRKGMGWVRAIIRPLETKDMQLSSAAKATALRIDERWKLLAREIECEHDPAKVIKLAQQLIAEFDRAHQNAKDSRQRLAS